MKKILLLLSIMALPIQAEEAKNKNSNNQQQEKKKVTDNWTGWKLALNQMFYITDITGKDSLGKEYKSSFLDYTLGGGIEYGWSLQNNFYVGVNTDLNVNWIMTNNGSGGKNNFFFAPKLTLKGGFTQGNAMAFLGAGLGYRFVLSEPSEEYRGILPLDKDGKQRHVPTWHAQVGGLYKISSNSFVGMTLEYERTFAKDDEITGFEKRKDVTLGGLRLIWKVGMQF